MKGKVYVGLSGGVDSAVSAALLVQQGYDVTGVFIRIALPGYPCSAGVDRQDALRVATHLKIPFLDIDLSEAYAKQVFAPAIAEFEKGRTPNPDALCNREIKFGLFYDFAMRSGADFVATGHYAQVRRDNTQVQMWCGHDDNKDQSYFLWAVPQQQLAHTLFPVGGYTKPRVREMAREFAPNADRKDSQGLCFLGDIDMADMLQRELSLAPGDVVDQHGVVVGHHKGAAAYTLGQRHGFDLFAQPAGAQDMHAHYVVAKDTAHNTITISTSKLPEGYSATRLTLTQTNWISEVPQTQVWARYRYRQTLIPAVVDISDNASTVTLLEAHFVPEGQSLVIYNEGQCFGGGVVDKAELVH
jgi:tRNA-specific 2-thiouridylase